MAMRVVEYVISELVRCPRLWTEPWDGMARRRRVESRIVGLGRSGGMIADARTTLEPRSLFARSEKADAKAKEYRLPLNELLEYNEALFVANRNTVLLHEEQFKNWETKDIVQHRALPLGRTVILAMVGGDNLCFCDTVGALGGEHCNRRNVRCMQTLRDVPSGICPA